MPLDKFIAHTSDPIYWSVIAATLMKKILARVKSGISDQEQESIEKQIRKLGEIAFLSISKAYSIDRKQTISLLKEDRIGGYSIIGESLQYIDYSKVQLSGNSLSETTIGSIYKFV